MEALFSMYDQSPIYCYVKDHIKSSQIQIQIISFPSTTRLATQLESQWSGKSELGLIVFQV